MGGQGTRFENAGGSEGASRASSEDPATDVYTKAGQLLNLDEANLPREVYYDTLKSNLPEIKSTNPVDVYIIQPNNFVGHDEVENSIREFISSERLQGERLILIGYSLGGQAALSVAEELKKEKHTVDILVTIDPADLLTDVMAFEDSVPDNVTWSLNYFNEHDEVSSMDKPVICFLQIGGYKLDLVDPDQTTGYNIEVGKGISHDNMIYAVLPDAVTQINHLLGTEKPGPPPEMEDEVTATEQSTPDADSSQEKPFKSVTRMLSMWWPKK
jgi:hypothetical protein